VYIISQVGIYVWIEQAPAVSLCNGKLQTLIPNQKNG